MRALIVSVLVLALLVGIWWLFSGADPAPPAAPVREGDTAAGDVRPGSAVVPPAESAAAALPGEQSFRQRLRGFVGGAAGLSEAERLAQAEALRRETLAREAEGSLVPAESAYIQLALLRATVTDEAEVRRRGQALLERYEAASEQGWADYRRRETPRHDAYREAEAALIRRAREDGLSDEVLRERLQALREQYYQ